MLSTTRNTVKTVNVYKKCIWEKKNLSFIHPQLIPEMKNDTSSETKRAFSTEYAPFERRRSDPIRGSRGIFPFPLSPGTFPRKLLFLGAPKYEYSIAYVVCMSNHSNFNEKKSVKPADLIIRDAFRH